MTRKSGALAALVEDPGGSDSRTHVAAHDRLGLQFRETHHPLLPSVGTRRVRAAQTYTQVSIHTHEK